MSDTGRSSGETGPTGEPGPPPGGSDPVEAQRRSRAAFAELEGALREATALLGSLKAANTRLKRQNADLNQKLVALKAEAERLAGEAEEARTRGAVLQEAMPQEAAALAAATPVSELAGRVVALEGQRREWLRDRRRLAERVEGILDKLEYLQSESSAN